MNLQIVIRSLGFVLLFTALSMLPAIAVALGYGDGDTRGLIWATVITTVAGLIPFLVSRSREEMGIREGFAIVTFSWVLLGAFGMLPYLFTGAISNIPDAFFETISGYTTTGSSAIPDVESIPHGILFWRSMTHWVGGMGIIVLSVAILPILGIAGMQLYKAEAPGPRQDKLTPRIRQTAGILWIVYLLFTAVLFVLLLLGGMDWFESINHTFSTIATGGFSTKSQSIAHFSNGYLHWVIIFFMYISAINFSLHWYALNGNLKRYWRSSELRFFTGALILAIALVTAFRIADGVDFWTALRHAAFNVVSLGTATGFANAQYESWQIFPQIIIVVMMVMGGMAGSTAGGMKSIRMVVLFKQARTELHKLIHPQTLYKVRIDKKPVDNEIVINILAFFFIYILLLAVGTLLLASMGVDALTGLTACTATMSNAGPGLGAVGPFDNFSVLPAAGMWLLSFLMIAGRLEFFTVIVLFTATYWRKV